MLNVEHHVVLSAPQPMSLCSLPLIPFACEASRGLPFGREATVYSSFDQLLASPERRPSKDAAFFQASAHRARSHLWQVWLDRSVLSSPQLVRHAPGQFMVGASRRSAAPGSQYGGAAEYGSAGLARLRDLEVRSAKLAPPYHLGNTEAAPRVMPNYSIERTSPGKPGLASHVKRWASLEPKRNA
jgi:hypothetical protein